MRADLMRTDHSLVGIIAGTIEARRSERDGDGEKQRLNIEEPGTI
jgi:hypothetical protein